MNENFALIGLLALMVVISMIWWRQSFIFCFYWIVLVGAVRKWIFPGHADILFFSPHLLLLGAYLRLFRLRIVIPKRYYFVIFFMAVVIMWGVLSILNFRSPDVRVGFLGFVTHFYFVPMMFLMPQVFPNWESLNRFLKKYAFFAVFVLILGIIQYFQPAGSIINRYVEEFDIALVGERARITGPFAYITGYGTYLNFIALILIYLISTDRTSILWRYIWGILFLLTVTNLFMSGSRGPSGITLISCFAFILLSPALGLKASMRIFIRIVLIVGILFLAMQLFRPIKEGFEEAYSNIKERSEGVDDVGGRLIDTFTPFKFLKDAGLMGYGIGTTYQGANRFVKDWGSMTRYFEEEPERILLEMGLIGYLLVYSLRLVFILVLWGLFKKLKKRELKLLALSALLFQAQFLQLSVLVFNVTAIFYYWVTCGFIFLLPRLEQIELNRQLNKIQIREDH